MAPRLVFVPGVYRSASTWAANVCAELLRPNGPAAIAFADRREDLDGAIGTAEQAVVKMHLPDKPMCIAMRTVPVVLTVRDPLDCVASIMRQFHEPFMRGAGGILSSAKAMLHVVQQCDPLVLHYERDARDAATVQRIAAHIGAPVDVAQADRIAAALSAEAVGAFIDGLVATGYFGDAPVVSQFHRETHWHPRHLGSGASGRFAEVLTPAQIASIDQASHAFRSRFGYLRAHEISEGARDDADPTR